MFLFMSIIIGYEVSLEDIEIWIKKFHRDNQADKRSPIPTQLLSEGF